MSPSNNRWLAVGVLCLGVFMVALDGTVVSVALKPIRNELSFSEVDLVWVVTAYTLTFGGCMIPGGRLGDLYGHRRLFLIGIALFTAASVACGLATSQWLLISARAVQGLGGAFTLAVALALLVNLFSDAAERARAIGAYSCVCACGGSVGLLLGGALTSLLGWRWIFFINIPTGILVFVLCRISLPLDEKTRCASLLPLHVLEQRKIVVSNIVGMMWAVAAAAWFFIASLYMQVVLDYRPMQVGLAFLPANVLTGLFALGISAEVVRRFGTKRPLIVGVIFVALGLALLAPAPLNGHYLRNILPSMILIGLGSGVAYNPLVLEATSDVTSRETGFASGVFNTSCMLGGAVGLTILASVAFSSGYRMAFNVAAGCAGVAALLGMVFLQTKV